SGSGAGRTGLPLRGTNVFMRTGFTCISPLALLLFSLGFGNLATAAPPELSELPAVPVLAQAVGRSGRDVAEAREHQPTGTTEVPPRELPDERPPAGAFPWLADYRAARQLSQKDGKPLLILFSSLHDLNASRSVEEWLTTSSLAAPVKTHFIAL